jgi:HD-GYP domain-containing protein (c-di-GMP phosphodiesterase class II)
VTVPRLKLPRFTFLAKFTILTFAVAVVAAVVLAFVLESLHQKSIERDEIVTTVGQIDAKIATPLERYATVGTLDAQTRAEFQAAVQDATLHEFVSGLRVYHPDGTAVYPADAPPDLQAVQQTKRVDDLVTVEHGTVSTLYEPYVTSAGTRFVVGIDVLPAQLHGEFAAERWQVVVATLVVVGLIFCALVALAGGASREIERRRRESEHTFVQTLTTLAEAVDLRDPYTAGHSRRVASYSRQLAVEMQLPPDQVQQIEHAALLHDIGKVGVPDSVLFKAGPLDEEERLLIRSHPVIGAGLIEGIATMCDIRTCILHHHERFDGSGYPDRLAGEQIPLGARIIAVADSFDAMTTDRPYRRGLGAEAAVNELFRGAGTQFDPRCMVAFVQLIRRGQIVPPPRAVGEISFARRPVKERLRVISN